MTLLDALRTQYKSLPRPVRKAIAAASHLLPLEMKYGSTYAETRKLIARNENDAQACAKFVTENLSKVLTSSRDHSSYYQTLFGKLGLFQEPDFAFSFDDFSKLPVLEKDIVRENLDALATVNLDTLDMVTTSGSSGAPMKFYLEKTRSVIEWAFLLHTWSQIGFHPSMTRAALRGFEISDVENQPWEYEAGLKELRLSPFHMNQKWLPKYAELIKKQKICFLHGYPSAIEILAKYALSENDPEFRTQIKGAILTSEALYEHQAKKIKEAFPNIQLVSFYGQSEKVLLATSDPDDVSVFRFNPSYGYAELISETGEPVTKPGETGRIVGTGLQFKALPFIRYDTGDVAELVEPASAENGFALIVKNIKPRRGQEFLIGANSEVISIAALNIHSDNYNAVEEFVIEQKEVGLVDLLCRLAPDKTEQDARNFADELARKTSGALEFNLRVVQEIPAGARGKRHWLRQSLDISSFQ